MPAEMLFACPQGMTSEQQIRRKVHDAYPAAAKRPEGSHAFPVGRQFAASLGLRRSMKDNKKSLIATLLATLTALLPNL